MTLSGGIEGLKFYLLPDFDRMKEVGLWETVTAAMNQAFFTLSLGIGSITILFLLARPTANSMVMTGIPMMTKKNR